MIISFYFLQLDTPPFFRWKGSVLPWKHFYKSIDRTHVVLLNKFYSQCFMAFWEFCTQPKIQNNSKVKKGKKLVLGKASTVILFSAYHQVFTYEPLNIFLPTYDYCKLLFHYAGYLFTPMALREMTLIQQKVSDFIAKKYINTLFVLYIYIVGLLLQINHFTLDLGIILFLIVFYYHFLL